MALHNLDLNTMIYLQSEAEFHRARSKGFWDSLYSLVKGHSPHLLPFDEVIKGVPARAALELGLQDIPLKKVRGSVGRVQDFSRHFMPLRRDEWAKERWRTIYTLAVSGAGFPPVEVYQLGSLYFVLDGHHRVSVAHYLGWSTLLANVTVWPSPSSGTVDLVDQAQGRKGVH
jgi:hypothetical protein